MIQLTDGAVAVQTQDQILAETNAAFRAEFGADFDLSDYAFTYRQNAIWATREAALQSLIASAVSAADLDHATGRQLDYLGSLLGRRRKSATRSTIPAVLFGTPGQAVGDKRVRYLLTGDQWRTPLGTVIGANGSVAVTLTSESTGPIFATAQASTAWVIVDVTTGFSRLESTADAQRGRRRELDPEYRQRLQDAVGAVGGTQAAVRAAIAGIEGVTAWSYSPNPSPLFNAEGVPPWHAEAVISGGTDLDIATALYNSYGDTTQYFGNTIFVVTDPASGVEVTVKWSRIVEFQVTASLTLMRSVDTPLPIDALAVAITTIADRINTNGAGIDVDPADLIAAVAIALPPGVILPAESAGTVAIKGGAGQATPIVLTHRDNAFTIVADQPATVVGTQAAPFNLVAGANLDITVGDEALFSFVISAADYAVISAATITELVAALSRDAPAGLSVGSRAGALALATVDTGTGATLVINASSDAALLTTLGLTAGATAGTPSDIAVTFTGP